MYEGLRIAKRQGFSQLIVESDSKLLVEEKDHRERAISLNFCNQKLIIALFSDHIMECVCSVTASILVNGSGSPTEVFIFGKVAPR